MRTIPTQDEINQRKDGWKIIANRMNIHHVTPEELASKTPYSQNLIKKGIGGEPIPITKEFARDCVIKAFKLREVEIDGRIKDVNYAKPVDDLSYEDYMELMKPPPAMPPKQGNFWEWDE